MPVYRQIAPSTLLVAFCLLWSAAPSHGQADGLAAFPNGRPAVNAGTDLVPVGAIQIENGFSWTDDGHSRTLDGPESLMRIGFSDHLELQVSLPDMHTPGPGLDDLAFGAKVSVGSETRIWPIALVATVSVPTGSSELTSGGIDPTLVVAVSHNFAHDLQFSGSADISSLSEVGSGRSTRSQLAFDLGWCIRGDTCLFVEASPFLSSESGDSGVTADAGMALRLGPHLPCDWRVGATTQPGGTTVFVSLGYSFRQSRAPRSFRLPARRQQPPPRYPRLDANAHPPEATYTMAPTAITTADPSSSR
jgi:hypothetical protein